MLTIERSTTSDLLPQYLRDFLAALPEGGERLEYLRARETGSGAAHGWRLTFDIAGTPVTVDTRVDSATFTAGDDSIIDELSLEPAGMAAWVVDRAKHALQVRVERHCRQVGLAAPKLS